MCGRTGLEEWGKRGEVRRVGKSVGDRGREEKLMRVREKEYRRESMGSGADGETKGGRSGGKGRQMVVRSDGGGLVEDTCIGHPLQLHR